MRIAALEQNHLRPVGCCLSLVVFRGTCLCSPGHRHCRCPPGSLDSFVADPKAMHQSWHHQTPSHHHQRVFGGKKMGLEKRKEKEIGVSTSTHTCRTGCRPRTNGRTALQNRAPYSGDRVHPAVNCFTCLAFPRRSFLANSASTRRGSCPS